MPTRPSRQLVLKLMLASVLVTTTGMPHPLSAVAAEATVTRPAAASIPPGTLLIGTYLVQTEALSQSVFTAAKATMEPSDQGVYYRSEFAKGSWMNIGKATDISALFKNNDGKSAPVSFDDIDNLQITFWITLQEGKPHVVSFLSPADLQAAIETAKTDLEAKKQEADSAADSQLSQIALDAASLQAQLDFLTAVQNGQDTQAMQALDRQADPASAVSTDLQKAQQTQRQTLQNNLDAAKLDLAAAQSSGDTQQIAALTAQIQDLTAQLQKFDVQIKTADLKTADDDLTGKLKDLQSAVATSQTKKATDLLLQVATAAAALEDIRQALLQQQLALTTDPKEQDSLQQASHTATQTALKAQNLKLRKIQENAKLTGQVELANLLFAQLTDNNAKRDALRQTDRQSRIEALQTTLATLQAQLKQVPQGQSPSGDLLVQLVKTQAQLNAEQQSLTDAATLAQEDIDFLQGMIDTYQAEENQTAAANLQPLLLEAKRREVDATKAPLFLQKYEAESVQAVQSQQTQPSPALVDLHKQTIETIEGVEKGRYTQPELDAVAQLAVEVDKQLGQEPHEILPVEHLISNSINFKLAAPLLRVNGTTMVPIRTLLEGFGAQVFWDDGEQMVRVEYQGRTVVAWIGKTAYQVNGEAKTIDVAPVLLAQRTYVPLRLLVEAFGFDVAWDEPTETIDVKGLPVEVTP
ncbi:hypothetical protein JJB07_15930 [Tumebacillus sp. ITR2]|uniref:Copper amine oxidase-like N-terminal domain-containing protein n=1 Tax=Tumebacillus amylolyticus TaxID=2801339 RepID=A0ABS1JCV8_9BACL|nr:hypothetical protein [Tumebacillus amylolyticus]